jgi:hypothetical protein
MPENKFFNHLKSFGKVFPSFSSNSQGGPFIALETAGK